MLPTLLAVVLTLQAATQPAGDFPALRKRLLDQRAEIESLKATVAERDSKITGLESSVARLVNEASNAIRLAESDRPPNPGQCVRLRSLVRLKEAVDADSWVVELVREKDAWAEGGFVGVQVHPGLIPQGPATPPRKEYEPVALCRIDGWHGSGIGEAREPVFINLGLVGREPADFRSNRGIIRIAAGQCVSSSPLGPAGSP